MENFADLRTKGYYYADKTMLIKELLCDGALVSLFTRPRRFGKTLNMSMLKAFFEIGTNESLFEGLAISREHALCQAHLGQYPVIFISLKNVEGADFASARKRIWGVIRDEARRFSYLLEKDTTSDFDRDDLRSLIYGDGDLEDSLKLLSGILFRSCGHKAVILIDEYDVPLDKANQFGYYDEMIQLIRVLFGSSLKTNDYLAFAVLTGCLRVSKESIFTGMNNFSVNGITDVAYDDCFGFTDADVRAILQTYDLTACYDAVKEWYDGYRFGNQHIYCPWDVVSYVRTLDTKGNYDLKIPNREISSIFQDQILEWFRHTIADDASGLEILCDAFADGETAKIENYLNSCLSRSISVRDSQGKSKTENFFHGMLLGMLDSRGHVWRVESNREAGDGYPDIVVSSEPDGLGFVIEIKAADSRNALESSANMALRQIRGRNYMRCFEGKNIDHIHGYGIAFYKKAAGFCSYEVM
ncbi:MAG: ATP-binding protein [Clostridiales bacterium]|nr:ATP-binding protein [Clostridiales bacterium]